MGCGCKKTNSIPEKILGNPSKNKIVGFLLFLVVSVLSVFLYPIILLILFKHFVIGGDIDIASIMEKFKKKSYDEEDDIDDISEDNYEMVSVENIKLK